MEIKEILKKIKSEDKEKTLRNAYDFMINHFSNERYNLILQLPKQFYSNNEQLLKKKQFAQCNLQSRVLKEILIKSRKFSEKDVKIKRKFIGLSFHYYLLVSINGDAWKVDPFFRKFKKL